MEHIQLKWDQFLLKIAINIYYESKKLWLDQWENFGNSFIQKWLDDNDILIYPTISQLLVRSLKDIQKVLPLKITANNKKSYFGYFNKLVYKYNNTYHHSIGKKPINVNYSVLTEEMKANPKSSKYLKLVIDSLLLGARIFLTKVTPKIG